MNFVSQHQHIPSFAFINPTPHTSAAASPLAHSHAVEVRHFLRVMHLSEQGRKNRQGEIPPDFQEQVQYAFENILFVLKEVDATILDLAVLRIYVVEYDANKYQAVTQVMQQLWENQPFPSCSLIPVPCLALPDMLIAIEATAYCL